MNSIKLLLVVLGFVSSISLKAQITGTVFRDYNGDGIKNNTAATSTTVANIEPGIASITINAFDSNDVLRATQVTDVNGLYTFPIGTGLNQLPLNTKVRLEYVLPSSCAVNPLFDFSSIGAINYGSNVQFKTQTSSAVIANYAVTNPAEYRGLVTNPKVFISRYSDGDPVAVPAGTASSQTAMYSFNYTATGNTYTGNNSRTVIATAGQIGSVWGAAYNKFNDRLYAAAVMKRLSGYGPGGPSGSPSPINAPGSIYMMNPNLANSGSFFFSFDALGSSYYTHDHTVGAALNVRNNVARGLNMDIDVNAADSAAFDQVGKVGLGDIDFSDDGRYLWVVNLYDRKIYRVDIQNPQAPVAPTAATASAFVTAFSLPSMACTNSVLRPWGLKWYKGKLYVGVVCTGENDPNANSTTNVSTNYNGTTVTGGSFNLGNAYILELNPAGVGSWSTTLTIPLNYPKGNAADENFNKNRWYNWVSSFPVLSTSTGGSAQIQPQPILSDIEFDTEGSLIIGFMDRLGNQTGQFTPDLNGNGNYYGEVGGDILRAYNNGCTYQLESNAKEGLASPKPATAGANSGQGPGSGTYGAGGSNYGEFYHTERYLWSGCSCYAHNETSLGSLAFLPGSNEVLLGVMDPITDVYSNGLTKFDNNTGVSSNAFEVVNNSEPGTFAKAISLGDIELATANSPVEIGNSVWLDINKNGIQDPNETGIANVTLEIFEDFNEDFNPDGAAIGTVTTNASGNYYFSSATGTDALGIDYNVALLKERAYLIRISSSDWDYSNGKAIGDLSGTGLSFSNRVGNGQPDISDNDAYLTSGTTKVPQIVLLTSSSGLNNSNYDFGFLPLGTIGNYAWTDANADGVNNEPLNNGLNGVKIYLYSSVNAIVGDADDLLMDSTITANNSVGSPGYYLFDSLNSGNYFLKFPTTYLSANLTSQTITSQTDNNSDANTLTGNSPLVVLNINLSGLSTNDTTIDVGYLCVAPLANAGSDKTLNCITNSTQIGTAPVGGNNYSWSPSTDLNATNIAQPTTNTSNVTSYTLTVTDATTGCSATDVVMVYANKSVSGVDGGTDKTITCTSPSANLTANGNIVFNDCSLYSSNVANVQGNATNAGNVLGTPDSVGAILSRLSLSDPYTRLVGDLGVEVPGGSTLCFRIRKTNAAQANGLVTLSYGDGSIDPSLQGYGSIAQYTISSTSWQTICATVNFNCRYIKITNDVGGDVEVDALWFSCTAACGISSYVWSSGETIQSINVSPSINTNYTVTVTNCNGCTATDVIAVNVNTVVPLANAGLDVTLNCTTTSATIGTTAQANHTYSWLPATDLSATNIAEPITTAGVTTTYTLTVTNTLNGCTSTDEVLVTVDTVKPNVFITGSLEVCNGNNTILTANGASTFVWNTLDTLNNILVNVGTYYVTGTNTNGCSSSDTARVVINEATIGNYVWIDENYNGINDEPNNRGINGLRVELWNAVSNILIDSTMTSNDSIGNTGYYEFKVCNSGDYFIQFPTNYLDYTITKQDSTTSTDNNNDANSITGKTAVFSLNINDTGVLKNNTTIDAGYVRFGSIGDLIWVDEDANGIQDDTSMYNMANIQVYLIGLGIDSLLGTVDDVVLDSTLTDIGGRYIFDSLVTGKYCIKFPLSYQGAMELTVSDTSSVMDGNSDANSTTGMSSIVNINTELSGMSRHNNSIDAGYFVFSTLPIEAIIVKGEKKVDYNEISWYGVNAIDIEKYELYKSFGDVNNFEKQTEVNATSLNKYSFIDSEIKNGDFYYKVKSVDKNGEEKYSNVLKISRFDLEQPSIYPNPVVNTLNIHLGFNSFSEEEVKINIYDNLGKLVWYKKVNVSVKALNIDVSELANGNYTISIGKYVYKLVKQ